MILMHFSVVLLGMMGGYDWSLRMNTSLPGLSSSPGLCPMTLWLIALGHVPQVLSQGQKLYELLTLSWRFVSRYMLSTLPSAVLRKSPSW